MSRVDHILADALGLPHGPGVVLTAARPGEGAIRAADLAADLRAQGCRVSVRDLAGKLYLRVASDRERWTCAQVERAIRLSGFASARRTSGSFSTRGPWSATWRVNP